MALANVACLLVERARPEGGRVLIVDWDVEAPGLHRLFLHAPPAKVGSVDLDLDLDLEIDGTPGLIDYFGELSERMPAEPPRTRPARNRAKLAALAFRTPRGLRADVPPARTSRLGRQNPRRARPNTLFFVRLAIARRPRSMNSTDTTAKMEVDLEGLIQILAKSLYSTAEVFVRELIQNAHDAIQMRLASGSRVGGRIDVRVDCTNKTITFSDNGLGMDEVDIRSFLAVIGRSNKPATRERLLSEGRAAEPNIIGQFGIGLLSAFMVASKLVVRTSKIDSKEVWEWENAGSAVYHLRRSERDEPGTDVIVTIRPDCEDFLDPALIKKIARRYMEFLPYQIFINGDGPINDVSPPWYGRWTSESERDNVYVAFLNARYPDIPLDVMPVDIAVPGCVARGVLYISSEQMPQLDSAGVVDVYVRRVLVVGRDSTILPRWARFVSGVIDSPDLKTSASRENLQREDPTFQTIQRQLGDIILARLRWLAQNQPRRFERITSFHSFSLLSMALANADFLEATRDLLLVPTNRGPMNLQDYLAASKGDPLHGGRVPIYYVATDGAAVQFFDIGIRRGWIVINATGYLVEPFLRAYAARLADRVRLVALEHVDMFERPSSEQLHAATALERDIDIALREAGLPDIHVRSRQFEPASIPGLVALAPKTEAQKQLEHLETFRSLMTGFHDASGTAQTSSQVRASKIDLAINLSNPVVQSLLTADRLDPAVVDAMVGLYSSALLGSHGLLNDRTVPMVSAHFQRLLATTLKSRAEVHELTLALDALRETTTDVSTNRPNANNGGVTIFMCTPYDDYYRVVEQAVRTVFERPPYCFRVRLARDFALSPRLAMSVVEHIRLADAFVADISEDNPNVMFELGAAVLTDRPIFLLTSVTRKSKPPVDLGDRLYISYPDSPIPPSEVAHALQPFLRKDGKSVALPDFLPQWHQGVAEAIRSGLERDGRPTHASLEGLLTQRRIRYLSAALFESLGDDFRVAPTAVASLMGNYESVEEVLHAQAEDVVRRTGIRLNMVLMIRAELQELVDGLGSTSARS